MAIGARILSNNLSGETAEVTFLPFTGGTFDLGTQTIPFNHLTSYPYGTYEVYVPRYDNTYEVVINAGVSGNTFSFVSKLVGNNNHGAATLDFNDLTAQVIDLTVDYTGWNIQDIYPITDYGYGYFFSNDNTCNLQWAIFTDSLGNVLESFQTDCNCDYNYDVIDGKWMYFNDQFNGILKYFNGKNVYTLNYDASYQSLDVNNDWDGVMSNDNFTITIYDNNTNIGTSYIVNGSDLTQFSDFDNSTFDSTIITYFSGSYIGEMIRDFNADLYQTFKIYDGTDGSLLQTLELTGDTYDNNYINPYGDNKIVGMFYNYNDNSVDYLIFQYDGNTDTLITTTHTAINYTNRNISSNTNFYPNAGGSESFVIQLLHVVDYNDVGYVVDYCDFIYMLSGDTEFTTYTFQDSGTGDKTIRSWFYTSNIISTICDNGDGYVSSLVINSSGVTITSSGILINAGGYTDEFPINNGFVNLFFTGSSQDGCTLTYINNEGVEVDRIENIPLSGNYEYNGRTTGNLFQFSNNIDFNCYINEMSEVFQTDNPLLNSGSTPSYQSEAQFKSDFIATGIIVNFNYNTNECNVLTSTGYTDTFILPSNQDWSIIVGSDKFMFTYIDLSGNTNIHLYDVNGNLLNSLQTEHTSYNSQEACGGRFVQLINENGKYYVYLVSETEISPSILTNDNDYYTFNDIVWWD
jgi:hypothetical protein